MVGLGEASPKPRRGRKGRATKAGAQAPARKPKSKPRQCQVHSARSVSARGSHRHGGSSRSNRKKPKKLRSYLSHQKLKKMPVRLGRRPKPACGKIRKKAKSKTEKKPRRSRRTDNPKTRQPQPQNKSDWNQELTGTGHIRSVERLENQIKQLKRNGNNLKNILNHTEIKVRNSIKRNQKKLNDEYTRLHSPEGFIDGSLSPK